MEPKKGRPMRRWLIAMLAAAIWTALAAAPALAGGAPVPAKPPSYAALGVFVGVVSLAIVMPVCLALLADRRLLRAERLVEDPEPVVQQSLVDRERGQEPDHVVVGPGLQDHESFTQAPLHDRVPVGAG
jgi:hypothetical protein